MIIYKITNKLNGKVYVGQTRNSPSKRFKEHLNSTKSMLSKAVAKYGKENFIFSIIMECYSLAEMDLMEVHYIALLRAFGPYGYNQTSGGNAKKIVSLESRKKQSNLMKGRRSSPSTEFKSGPRPHLLGAGNPMFGKTPIWAKPIRCIETGEIFKSIKHAALALNISQAMASLLASKQRGQSTRYKGLHLEYIGAT